MKKIPVVSPVLFWACFFLFGLTLCQTTPVAAAGGYRIHYRHCSIETATNRSISVVSSTGRHSSVKIQHVRRIPAWVVFNGAGVSMNAPGGTLYMTESASIPMVSIYPNLNTFYTEAPVDYLGCSGLVEHVIVNRTFIGVIESSSAFRSLKLMAQENSALSEYAVTLVAIYGVTPRPPMPIQTSGVILERLAVLNTPLSYVKVASKKCRTREPLLDKTFASLGGMGSVTPAEQASGTTIIQIAGIEKIQALGANIAPTQFLCSSTVPSIRATAVRIKGQSVGGTVGLIRGFLPASEFGASNFGTIYGQVGVCAVFWAGPASGPASLFHQGTIQEIATHPRKGLLFGTAHVKPTNEIRFVPKGHPLFTVCDDPGAH
ncbi:MAG TPA: hypothetical protein PKH31_13810 [Candidatus Sumerlaeota bacterium]|nr:hypothetical protein [Candidatus Sumerlaeota bacterium]